jgi:hypothetical protein
MTKLPDPDSQQMRLFRAMLDPLWFCRLLGYDRVSEEFHGPMLLDMAKRDLRRPLVRAAIKEQEDAGLLHPMFYEAAMDAGPEYTNDELEEWSREHFKTSCLIARCAKLILLWPEVTIAHWHCVEDKAIECSVELAGHFIRNKELRALRPEIMPTKADKRFSTSKGFTVKRRGKIAGKYVKTERHPTFFPKGASAEVTGGHAVVGWLDDIIGESTIQDSQMPVVRAWLSNTVANVVRTDGGWTWTTGTPWDEDDVYVDMERDPHVDHRVRACRETNGVPDYDGKPVLYDDKWLRKKATKLHASYAYQMMCDRVPDSERRWPRDWDGFIKLGDALEGKGCIFVLSDPAPMGLSLRGEKDRMRGDTGKDWWSIAVVRLRVRGDFQDVVLLDGVHSQFWTDVEGYDQVCRLMKKWNTRYFFDEDYSGGQLFAPFRRAAVRHGLNPYYERDTKGRFALPRYKESYIKNAKKQRFQKLCDRAVVGEVFIADSCPESFWKGDGFATGALTQASKWIPRRSGESSLKWDDDFDSWSRATDSALQKFAPQPATTSDDSWLSGGPDLVESS